MPREKQEQGERNRYSARYRLTIGPATGMDDSHDPSTVPDEGLVEAVNCRVHDGIIVSRGGQTPVNTGHPMSGCVYGLVEVEGGNVGANAFFLNGGVYGGAGFTPLAYFNAKTSIPTFTESTLVTWTLPSVEPGQVDRARNCFVIWGGKVISFAAEGANPYQLVSVVYDEVTFDITLEQVVALPAATTPSSLITMFSADVGGEAKEVIVIGTEEGGVLSYDGQAVVELAAAGTFDDRVIVSTYNGTLYAASTQGISRLPGWTSGVTTTTWVDATLPIAAFPLGVADFRPCFAVEYAGALYVGGYELIAAESYACLLKVVEDAGGATTVTIVLADDANAGSSLSAACVYNGALFFGYNYLPGYPGEVQLIQRVILSPDRLR